MKKYLSLIPWISYIGLFLFFISIEPTSAQKLEIDHIKSLKFRHIGPVGNRLISATGIPGDPFTYYAGAASGGIWKTTDGGITWEPIFDDKPVHAIGALEVALSDPNVLYAGTGEPFIRSNVSIGNGVWKSTDAGKTWEHMGLEKTGRISRIVIHPQNPDIIYAASLGHAYQPQKERGVYRSKDGGTTWEQVLMVNDSTGASDLVMDPNNPRILFAGMWQLDIKTWKRESGGKGSGIYVSRDGGDSWKKVEDKGLPQHVIGKVALAMSKANSNRVYALIETGDGVPLHGQPTDTGELWRSDDGGTTWKMVNEDRNLGGRGAYYTRCTASPENPDEIYFMAASMSVSIDGGVSSKMPPFASQPNWDHHHMWIDPTNGNRMIVAGDGGVSISNNRGKTWMKVQLPVAQLYHVTTDNNIPYNVYANRQDGPSTRGPSRLITSFFFPVGIPRGEWHDVGGGESGFATPDPTDPDVIWSSASGFGPGGGIVVKYNEKTRQFRNVEVWPEATFGSPAKDVKYRFQWTFPLLISPHDNNDVFVTSQYVHKTTNGGQSWDIISPDLTTNDKSKMEISGGLTPDNIGVEYCCVIYAFDESPVKKGVYWAGTNDGLVQVSQDEGATWDDVTANIPGLPPLGIVRNIEASKWDPAKAYITVDLHQMGDFKPYVYKTSDYGKTWTKITKGVEVDQLSYTRCVREDPVKEGLLYLGTERALYVSFDDGKNWQSLMTNLPASPMYWMDVQEHFNDLVVGTYGRGIWILDDLTPLQQMTDAIQKQTAHLFEPNFAYRFRPQTAPFFSFNDPSAGENPPPGAPINWWLGAEEKDSVILKIKNEEGTVIRTIRQKGKPGLNRFWWDLKEEPTKLATMRTKPQYVDYIGLGDDRTRKAALLVGPVQPLVPPGDYTIEMSYKDKSYTQNISVKKDPNSEGTLEDIKAQYEMMQDIKADMTVAVDLVNELELIRRQVYDLKLLVKERSNYKSIAETIDSLDKELIALENTIMQLKSTGEGQDFIRQPAQIIGKLSYLATTVQVSDFAPADQHKEVQEILNDRLKESQTKFNKVMQTTIPKFLNRLKEHGVETTLILKKP